MKNPEHGDYPDGVRPDQIFTVPIQGGELRISPSTDILHYYPWLDQWLLKYWDLEHEPPRFCNVVMATESAEWLVTNLDLEVCARTFITESELEHVRSWGASVLDAMFADELGDIDMDGIDGV